MTDGARRGRYVRLALLGLVAAVVAAYFAFDLGRYLDLGYLRQVHGQAVALVNRWPVAATTLFFVGYVAVAAASLPGAAVMTLAAGAVFGLAWGLPVVSFASSVGATLAMLLARKLLGESVQRRFARQLDSVNRGLARDGGFYLFSVRMVPLFPFFVINLVMGLTPIRTWTFYWVSQLGMLPGTFVYVFAGTELAGIERVSDVLSPGMIAALSLLGAFPLLARKGVDWLRRARGAVGSTEEKWPDTTTTWWSSAAARRGSSPPTWLPRVRARVTLIEAGAMGGDCLNTGCVPSKTLIRSARVAQTFRDAERFGIRPAAPRWISPRSWPGCGAPSIPSRRRIPWNATRASASTAWQAAPGWSTRHGTSTAVGGGADQHAPHRLATGARAGRAAAPGPGSGGAAHLRDGVVAAPSCPSAWWCWAAGPSAASWRRVSSASAAG